MAKLSLQFHARRQEIAGFVAAAVDDMGLWLAYETLSPAYSAELVAQGRLTSPLAIPESVRQVVLSAHPMVMDGAGPFGLSGSNPAALSILLGAESGASLGESMLGAVTDDREALARWRRLRRRMTSSFEKGAWAVNTATGARAVVANHYFSSGAKDLASRGVRMAGPTERISYELD